MWGEFHLHFADTVVHDLRFRSAKRRHLGLVLMSDSDPRSIFGGAGLVDFLGLFSDGAFQFFARQYVK